MKIALAFLAALALPALAADQTQIFPTETQVVRITPIYHATARITAGRDVIYIDPAKPAKIDGMGPGDMILITDKAPLRQYLAVIAVAKRLCLFNEGVDRNAPLSFCDRAFFLPAVIDNALV